MKRFGMSALANVFTNGFLAQTLSNLQLLFGYKNKSLSFQKWASTDVLGYLNTLLKISHVCFGLTSSSLTLQVSSVIASCEGILFVCLKTSQCSQRGGWLRWLIWFLNNNIRVCHNDREVSRNIHWASERFLCPQETRRRNLIICTHTSPLSTRFNLPCGCLSLAPLLLQGSDLNRVAVRWRAWSWPVWVTHSLFRLLLFAQWLAGSSLYWRIF